MLNFKEWLAKEKFTEVMVDPQATTSAIGAMVGAQQPNNPSNVAANVAKKVPQFAAAMGADPTVQALRAKVDQMRQKNNPQLKNVNNTLPPGIGMTLAAQGA